MKKRSLIVAHTIDNSIIGINGRLPWHLPKDSKFFKDITIEAGICIMGRKNYESLPDNYRPLPGRKNIILTKNPLWQPKEEDDENIFVVSSFWEALELAENLKGKEICFIGGADIYKLALENVILDKIHRTLVYAPGLKGDTFFPTEVIPRLIPSYKMFYNETFLSDTRHPYPFSIESWERT